MVTCGSKRWCGGEISLFFSCFNGLNETRFIQYLTIFYSSDTELILYENSHVNHPNQIGIKLTLQIKRLT